MRPLLWIFVLSAMTTCLAYDNSSECTSDLERRHLKGPVRAIHSEMMFPGGWPGPVKDMGPYTEIEEQFDKDGFVVEWSTRVRGEMQAKSRVRRERCRVLERDQTRLDPGNRRRELTIYGEDGQPAQWETVKVTKRSGDAASSVQQTYANGALRIKETAKQGPDGERNETTVYRADGSEQRRITKEQDSRGQRGADMSDGQFGLAYDEDASGAGVQVLYDANRKMRTVAHYDASGHRDVIEYFGFDNKLKYTLTNYEEERDEHGNWTRNTQYRQDPGREPVINSITRRTIRYQ